MEILAIAMLKPASNGRKNVLVLTDVFSKYTQAFPTQDQMVGSVARVLVNNWFNIFGIPT